MVAATCIFQGEESQGGYYIHAGRGLPIPHLLSRAIFAAKQLSISILPTHTHAASPGQSEKWPDFFFLPSSHTNTHIHSHIYHTHTCITHAHIKALKVFPELLRKPTWSCSLRTYYMQPCSYHSGIPYYTSAPKVQYACMWVCVCVCARVGLWQVPLENEEVKCQQLHSPSMHACRQGGQAGTRTAAAQ